MKVVIENLFDSFHHCVIYCNNDDISKIQSALLDETNPKLTQLESNHIEVYLSMVDKDKKCESAAKITMIDGNSFKEYQLQTNTDLIFNYVLLNPSSKDGIQTLTQKPKL
jgi:hypothetical protein